MPHYISITVTPKRSQTKDATYSAVEMNTPPPLHYTPHHQHLVLTSALATPTLAPFFSSCATKWKNVSMECAQFHSDKHQVQPFASPPFLFLSNVCS